MPRRRKSTKRRRVTIFAGEISICLEMPNDAYHGLSVEEIDEKAPTTALPTETETPEEEKSEPVDNEEDEFPAFS